MGRITKKAKDSDVGVYRITPQPLLPFEVDREESTVHPSPAKLTATETSTELASHDDVELKPGGLDFFKSNERDIFYILDPVDRLIKSDMASMEHPIFSLQQKPDTKIRKYRHNNFFIEVTPSVAGAATINDRDLLIYITTHLVVAKNEGKAISQTVKLRAGDFLNFSKRGSGGREYELLKASLKRLAGTRILTNIETGKERVSHNFGLIEYAEVREDKVKNRMIEVEVKLSDWLFKSIQADEILTVHQDYFKLSRPIARKLYELARKHCGGQPSWKISFAVCHTKTGSASSLKEFRRMIRQYVNSPEALEFPDYTIAIDGENILFALRPDSHIGKKQRSSKLTSSRLQLSSETLAIAKKYAPGYDVYGLEREWRSFAETSGVTINNPDAAFIGFCKKRGQEKPLKK